MARVIGLGALAGKILAGLFQPGMVPISTVPVADAVSSDDEALAVNIDSGFVDVGSGVENAVASLVITGADTGHGTDTAGAFNLAIVGDTLAATDGAAVIATIRDGDFSAAAFDVSIFGYTGVVPVIGRVARVQPENRTLTVPPEMVSA